MKLDGTTDVYVFLTMCSRWLRWIDTFFFFSLWLFRGSHRGGGAYGPARDRDLGLSPQCLSVFFPAFALVRSQSLISVLSFALNTVIVIHCDSSAVHSVWVFRFCHWLKTLPRVFLSLSRRTRSQLSELPGLEFSCSCFCFVTIVVWR